MGALRVDLSELAAIRRILGDVTAAEFAVPTAKDMLETWRKVAVDQAPLGETRELVDGIEVMGIVSTAAGAAGEIVSKAGHSGFVNFGTERQSPQPFFTAGALAVSARLSQSERLVAAALDRKLSGASVAA